MMLEVAGLKAGYNRVEVLRGVDLSIRPKEIVALLGSNGVGKTTFIATLSGLIQSWSGKITFKGQDITRANAASIVDIGLIQVPEGRHIFPNLTVQENLVLGSYRRGRNARSTNLERVLETFPRLRERLRQKAATMSGGEQQMLAIGRGMMAEPELLILDEPSLGLSPLLVEEMFELIVELNKQGMTILLVEQNVHLSLEISHRGFVMENGSIKLTGTANELLDNPDLQKSYLGV